MSTLHLLIVSLSLGALIGLVRQWAEQNNDALDQASAGLRTFSLWSLLGFISAFLGEEIIFPLTLFMLGGFITAYLFADLRENQPRLGLTGFAAAIGTFFIGALVYKEEFPLAIVTSCVLMLLIASKPLVHNWVHRMTKDDISLFVRFAAVSGIILPLVPDEGYGPFNAFNPYNIWLMVVLISGLGFAGYVASRWLGSRAGITVTGMAGGLASSTATTVALSRQSKVTPELSGVLAQGILVACIISLVRVIVIAGIIAPVLIVPLLGPSLLLIAPGLIWVSLYFLRTRKDEKIKALDIKNPLSLKMALTFALFYAVITFLIRAFESSAGFYALAFISGIASMDAIVLSLASNLGDAADSIEMAVKGIILATVANTIFKLGFSLVVGTRQLRTCMMLSLFPMIITGVLAFFVVR